MLIIEPGRAALADLLPRLACARCRGSDGQRTAGRRDRSPSATGARIVARGVAAYGINTGFGLLARKRIADTELEQLQRNLILSHSVGTGDC